MDQTAAGDDRQLLEAFATQQDQTAFAQIVDRHAPWVFAAALRQLKDRHLAEDAVQIVFITLSQKAHTMNARQKLSGWLFNTLNFTVKNVRRAEQSRRKHEAAAAHSPVATVEQVSNCAEEIDAAVAQLSKSHRLAILLRFYRDLSFGQIAAALGTTEAAARKRVDRALTALRKHLGVSDTTSAVIAASAVLGRDQSPPLLGQNIARAVIASKSAGMLPPAISAGVTRVRQMMTMATAQTTALALAICLIIALPATIAAWRTMNPTVGVTQTNPIDATVSSASSPSNPSAPRQAVAGNASPNQLAQITGTVTNQTGAPIPGASVSTIRTWYVVNDGGKKVTTGRTGHFQFPPQKPGTIALTITARGYGPELQRVDATPGMPPVQIVLAPGKTIRARILDENEKPVDDAVVRAQTWREMSSLPWQGRTDRDGRFVMPDAPPDAVEFSVTKDGYENLIGQDSASLTAADTETILTMRSLPVAQGTVVDADTGKPIPNFDLVTGWTFHAGYPPFYMFDHTKTFSKGQYKMTINGHSEVVNYYLRVEADGYAPAVSPPFRTSGQFDLALHRSPDLRGRVIGSNGNPIANVKIILVLSGGQVDLYDNRLLDSDGVRVAETNAAGEFNFRPQIGRFHLLAICGSGYALKVFNQQPPGPAELKISPWARIAASHPLGENGNDPVKFQAWIRPILPEQELDVNYDWYYHFTTSSNGEFQMNNVPSFPGQPVQLGFTEGRLTTGSSQRRWIPIRLSPGKTLHLNLSGPSLVGSIGKPGIGPGGVWGSIELIPLIKPPAKNWPADWSTQTNLPPPLYKYEIHGAGTFRISGVQPGDYLYETWLNSQPPLRAQGKIKIPAGDSTTTIDLGEILGLPVLPLNVGQPAPEILGHTLDETPISLHDFAGKYVLAVLWDNDGPESAAAMPLLETLAHQFSGNPHVALLGLNRDAIANNGVPFRPATLAIPTWINGYIPQLDDLLNDQLGGNIRPGIFILSPDGKLLARDVPVKEAAQTLTQFLQASTQPSTNPSPR
jgi:RNA polymerase sigma factor (sigma-70 family)